MRGQITQAGPIENDTDLWRRAAVRMGPNEVQTVSGAADLLFRAA